MRHGSRNPRQKIAVTVAAAVASVVAVTATVAVAVVASAAVAAAAVAVPAAAVADAPEAAAVAAARLAGAKSFPKSRASPAKPARDNRGTSRVISALALLSPAKLLPPILIGG